MEVILQNFNFLEKLAKSSPKQFSNEIKAASDSELEALFFCLSQRKHINPAHWSLCRKIAQRVKTKGFRKFAAKKRKHILPIVACILSKVLQEIFYYIYDTI